MKLQQGRPSVQAKPTAAPPQVIQSAPPMPSVVRPLDPSDKDHALIAWEQSINRKRVDCQQPSRFKPKQERVASGARWGWWVAAAITFLVVGAIASSFPIHFAVPLRQTRRLHKPCT
jgi:hypothetical protein